MGQSMLLIDAFPNANKECQSLLIQAAFLIINYGIQFTHNIVFEASEELPPTKLAVGEDVQIVRPPGSGRRQGR